MLVQNFIFQEDIYGVLFVLFFGILVFFCFNFINLSVVMLTNAMLAAYPKSSSKAVSIIAGSGPSCPTGDGDGRLCAQSLPSHC